MNKTLLVLAASHYQLASIRTAKSFGYRVVTTDNVIANPGHALADKSYDIDTTDVEAVCRLASRERISGIIAAGTDVAVVTAATVAGRLGLVGPPPEAAHILTDKLAFRRFLMQSGLPCPQVLPIGSGKILANEIFDGRAWLLKPCRASGSKGVFIVRDEETFIDRVGASQAASIDGMAILEEFIDGSQHTCEGLLENGKAVLTLITDRDTAEPPYTATTGHRVPSILSRPMQLKALSTIEDLFRRLKVISGPFDCDFVAAGDRVTIIELTPRLGGNSLSTLFQSALDFDPVSYAVRHACGDSPSLPPQSSPRPAAVAILGTDRAGRLQWNQDEAEALRLEDWVQMLVIDYPLGTPVQRYTNGRNRVGEALILGADRTELDMRLQEFKRRLALTSI